ncbi:MAG: fumarylacetoacetate hydrolase family protein [Chloroflexota bacterium]
MTPYRLATLEIRGVPRAALVLHDRYYPLHNSDVAAPLKRACVLDLLADWADVAPSLQALADAPARLGPGVDADDARIKLLTPIRYPRAVYCTVFNYYDFAREAGVTPPDKTTTRPYVCIKLPHTVIGPGDAILLPEHTAQLDWEVELGAVIGQRCRDARAENALDYVAAYTIVNDLSARDVIIRPDWPNFASDWLVSKNFDTGTPIGPYLTPAPQIPDPQNVPLRLWLNDQPMQDGNTSSMIFTLAEQIAHISSVLTLLPGDVIATGTPAGVGWKRGRFLQVGDDVRCEIPGIGSFSNSVVGPVPMLPPSLGERGIA